MAGAMGFGRFFYTPVLPGMMSGLELSATDAGNIAAANFAGYLAGAILSAYGWAAGRERLVALGALVGTALLLLAMGVANSVTAFIVIRFLAGIASAFAMVFVSSIVLAHGQHRPAVTMLHYGGVGTGIALSSALAYGVNGAFGGAAHGWRVDWIAGAVIVAIVAVVVHLLLPRPVAHGKAVAETPIAWSPKLGLVVTSYALFGFGYVITATFLVTIARMGHAGPVVEFLAWFITGCAAAVSIAVWNPLVKRVGLGAAYIAATVLLGAGVLASVTLPPVAGALTGGFLLGATFMVVTAFGLQIGRHLAPKSQRRIFATMTAAFGSGQIVGPLAAGWIAERSGGSFTAPTLLAVAILAIAVLLVLPLARFRG